MKFTPDTKIAPHADVVWRLVEGATLGTVCAALAQEFDAPVDQIQQDVDTLMGHLLAADLITTT